MEIVRLIIECGYFWLSNRDQHYPHRRAVWAYRFFLRGPVGTNWATEVLRARNFVRFAQNYFTQISKLHFWVIPVSSLDYSRPPMNQNWGTSVTVWDTGRTPWPANPANVAEPHRSWTGGFYRGAGYGYYPLPPSVSYRYKKNVAVSGRAFYGYLRCVESIHTQQGTRWYGERLPYHVHPDRIPVLHAQQVAEPLQRSGMNVWHSSSNPVREVVMSFRGGQLSVLPVSGYVQGQVTSSSRNFVLKTP